LEEARAAPSPPGSSQQEQHSLFFSPPASAAAAMTLTQRQRGIVEQVVGVTGASAEVVERCLRETGWSADAAANIIFERNLAVPSGAAATAPAAGAGGAGGSGGASRRGSTTASRRGSAAAAVTPASEFARLAPADSPDRLSGEALVALCGELGVDPFEDYAILAFAHACGAKTPGTITAAEWAAGMGKVGVPSVAELKGRIASLRAAALKPPTFAPFWRWVYS
jgi:hypothetical protein